MVNFSLRPNSKVAFFAVAKFGETAVQLLVAYYYLSTFYVVFNQKLFKQDQGFYWFRPWQAVLLNRLLKQANRLLGTSIKFVSYNFPTDSIKIRLDYSYYHRFERPLKLNFSHFNTLMRDVLTNWKHKDQYLNFSFHPQTYYLPEKQERTPVFPTNTIVSNLQITGVLYQVEWKVLSKYLNIFRFLNAKPIKPVLFPYAVYVGYLPFFQTSKVVILDWKANTSKLFYFQNHVYLKQKKFASGFEVLFDELAIKFDISREDAENYFFHVIQIRDLSAFESALFKRKPRLKAHYEDVVKHCNQFLKKHFRIFLKFIHQDWKLLNREFTLLLTGKLTAVNTIKVFFEAIAPKLTIKIFDNHFVGLTTYEDNFLIGNAYYQHLQMKIQNEKSSPATAKR